MSNADFEALYQADPDPWSYLTSDYERDKYQATLAACTRGRAAPFTTALELGASIGAFTARLAPACRSLITVDASPTAVADARRRLLGLPHVTSLLGVIPDAIPLQSFELVVASEILYYLAPVDLSDTLDRLGRCLGPQGRLVAVHWRPAGPERPFTAAEVHARLHDTPWLAPVAMQHTDDYLLDVFERRGEPCR
ncbi:MAG: methyltransferase domain-containing protein [Solirubrobacterales bacterium]|nr:methyltransferase domain-containing protein [Solirubrobacterales bacterium]